MQILCFSRPSVLIMKFHEKEQTPELQNAFQLWFKTLTSTECPKINRHSKDKHRDMEGQ